MSTLIAISGRRCGEYRLGVPDHLFLRQIGLETQTCYTCSIQTQPMNYLFQQFFLNQITLVNIIRSNKISKNVKFVKYSSTFLIWHLDRLFLCDVCPAAYETFYLVFVFVAITSFYHSLKSTSRWACYLILSLHFSRFDFIVKILY